MRIAIVAAGLSVALATPALADNAATTYGPTGPLPSVINPDAPRGVPAEYFADASEMRVTPVAYLFQDEEARSVAQAQPVVPQGTVTPGQAPSSDVQGASGARAPADAEAAGMEGFGNQ